MPEYLGNQTKQIAITADNPEEAQKKLINGEGTIISVNLSVVSRPQPAQAKLPERPQ
jgi:hypothetical protein